MSEFEAAELAVQAALDAGARYADARVMHRRYESMSARNGDIEARDQHADSGIGVRALVGSGWGFFATADLADGACARPGAAPTRSRPRAPSCPAPPSGSCRRAGHRLVGERVRGRPVRRRAVDKGDLLVRATTTMREHGADLAEGLYQLWDTRASGSSRAKATASTSTSASAAPASRRRRSATARPNAAPTRLLAGSTARRVGSSSTRSTSTPTPPGSARRPGSCSPRRRARPARRR